jgi:hypothetical protein
MILLVFLLQFLSIYEKKKDRWRTPSSMEAHYFPSALRNLFTGFPLQEVYGVIQKR